MPASTRIPEPVFRKPGKADRLVRCAGDAEDLKGVARASTDFAVRGLSSRKGPSVPCPTPMTTASLAAFFRSLAMALRLISVFLTTRIGPQFSVIVWAGSAGKAPTRGAGRRPCQGSGARPPRKPIPIVVSRSATAGSAWQPGRLRRPPHRTISRNDADCPGVIRDYNALTRHERNSPCLNGFPAPCWTPMRSMPKHWAVP